MRYFRGPEGTRQGYGYVVLRNRSDCQYLGIASARIQSLRLKVAVHSLPVRRILDKKMKARRDVHEMLDLMLGPRDPRHSKDAQT